MFRVYMTHLISSSVNPSHPIPSTHITSLSTPPSHNFISLFLLIWIALSAAQKRHIQESAVSPFLFPEPADERGPLRSIKLGAARRFLRYLNLGPAISCHWRRQPHQRGSTAQHSTGRDPRYSLPLPRIQYTRPVIPNRGDASWF